MKRGSGALLIAGALLILILVLAVSVPHEPLGTGILPWLGTHLTTEVQPQDIISTSTTSLSPGTVWEITDNPNGVKIEERNTQLIETIQLNNVDLTGGDIVASHLFTLYINDLNVSDGFSNVEFSGKSISVNTSAAPWGWTIATRYKLTKVVTPSELGYPDAYYPIAGWKSHWQGYVGAKDYGGYYSIAWIGNHPVSPSSQINISSWIDISASRIVDNPNQTRGIIIENGINYNESITTVSDGRYGFTATSIPTIGEQTSWHSAGYIGYIDYAIYYTSYTLTQTAYNEAITHIITTQPYLIFDPTWYNGTNYIDLISNAAGTPQGTVRRIPAEETWLWLITNVASDGKLHVRFVPAGSTLRIHYNGMVYEWRITGTPNAAGLIEDYSIDLASAFGLTTIPNATVELVYPSQKIRVYGPSGFTLKLIGNGWNQTAVIPDNASYVDFAVPDGNYTLQVLGYDVQPGVNIETSGDTVRITVTNENREALPGAKVYVYDTSGQLVFAGTTNDLGMASFNKSSIAGDQARIVVSYLAGGKYYHVDQVVSLTSNYHIEPVTPTPNNSNLAAGVEQAQTGSGSAAIVIVLLLVLLAAVIVILRRGRLK